MVVALLEVWKDNRTDTLPVSPEMYTWTWWFLFFPPSQCFQVLMFKFESVISSIFFFSSYFELPFSTRWPPFPPLWETLFSCLQELNSSVSDIVEGILQMHDTTKVRHSLQQSVCWCSCQEDCPLTSVPLWCCWWCHFYSLCSENGTIMLDCAPAAGFIMFSSLNHLPEFSSPLPSVEREKPRWTLNVLVALTDGSPDPGGLPDLECEERSSQWVLKSAFPGECTLRCSLKACQWQHTDSVLYIVVFIQVCHIVLGLRPGTPEEEGQIIRFVALYFI